MKSALNSDLIYEVLSVVEEIPEGRVAKSIEKQMTDVSGMITDECGISFLTGIIIQSF